MSLMKVVVNRVDPLNPPFQSAVLVRQQVGGEPQPPMDGAVRIEPTPEIIPEIVQTEAASAGRLDRVTKREPAARLPVKSARRPPRGTGGTLSDSGASTPPHEALAVSARFFPVIVKPEPSLQLQLLGLPLPGKTCASIGHWPEIQQSKRPTTPKVAT
jgi:hypothetical protein